ncbi:glycosyl transferase, partial [Nocardioides sp. YIM 152588]
LWRHRDGVVAGPAAALAVVVTAVMAFVLLGRSPDFLPWLRWVVLVLGIAAAVVLAGLRWLPPRLVAAAAAVAVVAGLAGPTAYAVQTAGTAHTGSLPTAGPSTGGGFGGRGGPGGPPGDGGAGGRPTPPQGQQGQAGPMGGGPPGGQAGAQAGGGAGGLLNGSDPSAELTALLAADADDYTWVAAAVGSNNASGYQLATEEPVMAIGGFNGSDPSPTLAEFQDHVAAGEIHYFIGGGGFGRSMGGSGASSEIAAWVQESFASTTVDGVTVYDLTTGTAS